MAIEVRIPTILRTYTDGAKAVEGNGHPPTSSPTWRAATPASVSDSSTARTAELPAS
ncbi:hypothetical protein SBADM41S_01958 [Streptomyces badius]